MITIKEDSVLDSQDSYIIILFEMNDRRLFKNQFGKRVMIIKKDS